MAFGKIIGLQGLVYKGGGPMLAWLLHRITGLGILIFVGLHVIASFTMQQFGSDLGTSLNIVYEDWRFQIFIYFCVLFHALNGLRVILLDIWPKFLKYQREAIWLQWLIFIPVYSLTVFIMIQRALAGG
jgi:succinate dehydrogenase / fumarate reductase, cytochrome b subunit